MEHILVAVGQADIARFGVHLGGFEERLDLNAGLAGHVGPVARGRGRHLCHCVTDHFAHGGRPAPRCRVTGHGVKVRHRRSCRRTRSARPHTAGTQGRKLFFKAVEALHEVSRHTCGAGMGGTTRARTPIRRQQRVGQGQFQTLLVGAAGKAALLFIERGLQLEDPRHIGSFKAALLA